MDQLEGVLTCATVYQWVEFVCAYFDVSEYDLFHDLF